MQGNLIFSEENMKRFIQGIHINRLFHLNSVDIPITDDSHYNLIITGKNGSGKTVLLNTIKDFINSTKDDKSLYFTKLEEQIKTWEKVFREATDEKGRSSASYQLNRCKEEYDRLFGRINILFNDIVYIYNQYRKGEFILAFYGASRNSRMVEPKNPTKPTINRTGNIYESSSKEFLNFLSDLKIQEALARNEHQLKDADEISAWFNDFEQLLQELFSDSNLKLEFNYRNYSFTIRTGEKSFKFTELSDGFSAVLDIITDLILKIERQNSLTRAYNKEGIVFVDEIETHLHLQLQKAILPLLVRLFPKIQFIVTTHSPFVLNSIDCATVYDLEYHTLIKDGLSNASYSGIVEGYFKQDELSKDLRERLDLYRKLTKKKELNHDDFAQISSLETILSEIPDYLDLAVATEFKRLKLAFENREDLH